MIRQQQGSDDRENDPHRERATAESFGGDAARYDRARPPYPAALIERIVAASPGPALLDVGCGTGIAARQLAAAGCHVLGVDPDARMAAVARAAGVDVEVAGFEAWDPAGRTFDAVTAAQSWHWVDPVRGPTKAAEVLRPGGLLALFTHVFDPPPPVADAFVEAFRHAAPDSPLARQQTRSPRELGAAMYAGFASDIAATGRFGDPDRWHVDWQRDYTRAEWLDLLPTTGALTLMPPDRLRPLLDAVGRAIDAEGGRFTMEYTTLVTTATRR